jgi:hypothetical protein
VQPALAELAAKVTRTVPVILLERKKVTNLILLWTMGFCCVSMLPIGVEGRKEARYDAFV